MKRSGRLSLIGSDKGGKTVKKGKNVLIILIALLCAAATGAYAFLFVLWDDTTAPQIALASDVLEVSVSAGTEELLNGVTATDNADGDVTDSILIEGIVNLNDQSEATITYAAFDKAGNVAKVSRTLKYTDYHSPMFGQNKSLTFSANNSSDILSCVTASDVIDGDISSNVKGMLVSDTGSLNYAGLHEVEFRVTNSMGDTQYLTLPVEIYENGAYNATVELTDYLIYLPKDADFNAKEYLGTLTAGGNVFSLTRSTLRTRVYINNYVDPSESDGVINVDIVDTVDTSVPGVYSVAYTASYEGMYTGHARLNVVVEE